MPDPMQALFDRLGYVRRDVDQAVTVRQDTDPAELPTYPQVVIIQGDSTGESWVRDHAGQLLVGAGIAVLSLAALAVVALVAIVTAVAMVTCVTALALANAAVAGQSSPRRGRRYR